MADEEPFTAPTGGFITAGSKKAVTPSTAPFDPFADDAAPALDKREPTGAWKAEASAVMPARTRTAGERSVDERGIAGDGWTACSSRLASSESAIWRRRVFGLQDSSFQGVCLLYCTAL